VFAKDRIRKDGQWTQMLDRTIEPNRGRPHFKGKVAVLMGHGNLSSSESFVLMMKQADACKLIGEQTAGSSGNPRPHDLGNGVVAFLSSWEDFQPDGTPIEGVGIKPDIAIPGDAKNYEKADPVLDAAMKYLAD
jgi:C-terminal processing protease CtpA/Prc